MGLTDFIRGQLIEIIEWTDDSRDTLSYRFPDQDREIKRGAQLVVRESQVAQLVYLGQLGDTYGPGKHTLVTANTPVLTRLAGWKYGFESPFKADVYFITTRLVTGNKWGTSNPVMLRDRDLGVVRARAFGTYDFRVVDARRFLKNVAGTDNHFTLDEFSTVMRSRIVAAFSEALAAGQVPVLDLAARYREIGQGLLPAINPPLRESYGLEVSTFVVENVSVPPEVEEAIDKRASMAAVGDLNAYAKYQMAQGFEKDGAGVGRLGAEMAVGSAIAQQMTAVPTGGGAQRPPTPNPADAGAPGVPETLSPAEAARVLGVAESDVVASLESGDLKGKRIGTRWRITKDALAAFLK